MTNHDESGIFVDTTVVVEKVPTVVRNVVDLCSLEKYKDRKSVAEALLDDDFSNPMLAKIAKAVLIEDKKKRHTLLTFFQKKCSYEDFKKMELALDDKGYMYDTRSQAFDWKYVRALARCWNRGLKRLIEENEEIKKKNQNSNLIGNIRRKSVGR